MRPALRVLMPTWQPCWQRWTLKGKGEHLPKLAEILASQWQADISLQNWNVLALSCDTLRTSNTWSKACMHDLVCCASLCRAKAKRKRRKRKSKAKAEGETGSATGESEDTANEAGGDDAISPAPASSSSRHASHRSPEQTDRGEQGAQHMAHALDGPKAEAYSEQRQAAEKRPEQGSATRGSEIPASSRSAGRDEEEDPAADTCAQQEVREKLEAAIAAATVTVELGNEAGDSQVWLLPDGGRGYNQLHFKLELQAHHRL